MLKPTPRNRLLVAAIAGTLASVVALFIWMRLFSGRCVTFRQPGELSEEVIWAITYQKQSQLLLKDLRERLKADYASIFVYDQDLVRRSFLVGISDSESSQAAWINIQQDDVYLDQRDRHVKGECWVAQVDSLRNGLYKATSQAEGVKTAISCPIVAGRQDLFGYVRLAYTQPLSETRTQIILGTVKNSAILVVN
jgi:hypothetical protein